MVKHIVMFTFKDDVDKDTTTTFVASLLEPLVGKIPGLLHLEVRRCFQGVDFALYSELESKAAVEAYAVHPLHLEALGQFKHLLASRVCADYEF